MNEPTKQFVEPTELGLRLGVGIESRRFIISLVDQKLIESILSALAEWEALVVKFEDSLFPLQAAHRLKDEIGKCKCPVEMPKLTARLAAAQAADHHTTYSAAAIVNTFKSEKIDPLISEFYRQASSVALDRIAEVTELEAKFFAQFGLPEQATAVRNGLLAVARELSALIQQDKQSHTFPGTVTQPLRAKWIREGCTS